MSCDTIFVDTFFKMLEQENIKYCILRNVEEVINGDAHDIDMTVDVKNMGRSFQLLYECANQLGWKQHMITGTKKDRINIKCINFYKIKSQKPILLHFDFFPTITWNGMVLLTNEELIRNINYERKYATVNSSIEGVTKLFIRLLHNGYIKDKYKEDIYKIFTNNSNDVCKTMQSFLSEDLVNDIYDKVINRDWEEIINLRGVIINNITKRLSRKPNYVYSKFNYYIYLFNKLTKKSGPMIVFEGTDGSGKTTIINNIPEVMERTFNETLIDYYHWRPKLVKSPKKSSNNNEKLVCTEPHKNKAYNKYISILKFLYFNIDYILGYWLKVRIQMAKGRMVVFDRYYYDYYLDKIRYRLDISDKVIDLCKPLIPKPDITFLLVGDPKVLYERKKEIPLIEIERQVNKIIEKKDKFHNSVIIDVNRDIDTIVNEVCKEILKNCDKKYY